MLRSVLGKTSSACSSTKFAELSNPEMPSMEAAKPKKSAITSPFSVGRAKLVEKTANPLPRRYNPPASSRNAGV